MYKTHVEARVERRRTIRIKRSGLLRNKLDGLDRPAIKFAETKDELEQAFRLVYDVYWKKKYITVAKPHRMLYSIFSLLPTTTHIVAKSYLTVISTLTEIFDTKGFGLPMDVIYKSELDELRAQHRTIVELSALATPREHRWMNIFLYQVQVMYWYSVHMSVDDICIAINPRHVRYYLNLFPFEIFGPERHYPRVDAPAVALRGKVKEAQDDMKKIAQDLDFDTDLKEYFYRMASRDLDGSVVEQKKGLDIVVQPNRLTTDTVQYFLDQDKELLKELTPRQVHRLKELYPGLEVETGKGIK